MSITDSGKVNSPWKNKLGKPTHPQLASSMTVDVVVVGGGITGLTAALRLAEGNKRVALVEAAAIGNGTTGSSTGQLTTILDTRWRDLVRHFGEDQAREVFNACAQAISTIESFVKSESIECDFRRLPGFLFTESSADVEALLNEVDTVKRLSGEPAEFIAESSLPFQVRAAMKVEHQALLNPLAYAQGLAQAFVRRGGHLFENTRVENIDTESLRVQTNHGTITARTIVLATHSPLGSGYLSIQSKMTAKMSYVLGVTLKDPLPVDGIFWDMEDPYHYINSFERNGERLLIIGGEDHKAGDRDFTEQCYLNLERYARSNFNLKDIRFRWSAQYYESADGLPYIGHTATSPHIYVATGFSGNGLTFGTIAGISIAASILGVSNTWGQLFLPGRLKTMDSILGAAKEVVKNAVHFIGDRLTSDSLPDFATIRDGEGQVVVVKDERVAAYRDNNGDLHTLSAICTHSGCVVKWNSSEQTWDCPCHGGRFTATGDVKEGPPLVPLARKTVEDWYVASRQ